MKPEEYYNEIIRRSETALAVLRRRAFAVAMLRLAVFVLTVAACFTVEGAALVVACLVAGLAIFLWLAKAGNRIAMAKSVEQAKIDRTKLNIDRLNLKFDNLPEGREYIDATHDFTFDIDVFGSHSLYSLLNSTSTEGGSRKLAGWLIDPKSVSGNLHLRQEAIQELSGNDEFRLRMVSIGHVVADEVKESKVIDSSIPDFSINPMWRIAVKVIPFVFIAMFALMAIDIIPGILIFYMFLATLIVGSAQAKRVGRLHEWLSRYVKRLSSCSDIFKTIESEQFQSQLLRSLQSEVKTEAGSASTLTARLARHIHNLDQRYNAFGYAIMNGFLLWDLRQLDNIDKWMKANGENIEKWNNAIAEFDALCALAVFRFNNPDYVFPTEDSTGKTIIKAKDAGHPLIPAGNCVCNDIDTLRLSEFFIVTGANMAGKSTYLRTIAVNYLLAMIGAPVFAKSMVFTPATLYTGLRASDSLSDGASYFFAELKRLQTVVKRAESGEKMLVILDEILRGTNSADKQKGSLGLVRKLVDLPVAGIIATHDLALGSLAESFPGRVRNFRFEAEISGDKLTFSYHVLPGIAENTNAYYLMQTMGII